MMAMLSYKSRHKRFKLINLTDWNKKDLKKIFEKDGEESKTRM